MTPDFNLAGKVVVLTGAAGIIGSSTTRALASHGAQVAAVDRDDEALDRLIRSLPAELSERVACYHADVTDKGAVTGLADRVEGELGPVNALCNNVAGKTDDFFAPFEEFPIEDWNAVMAINVTSAMLCSQAFGPAMVSRGKGVIVNTLSIYGIVGPDQRIYEGSEYEGRAINTPAIYSASKAALLGLTKYLATYWGPHGVRTNAVTPGGIFSGQNDTFVERYSHRVPMGRMGQPHDIAGAIAFLASDAAGYINGQNIIVDGGLTAW